MRTDSPEEVFEGLVRDEPKRDSDDSES